ncbi:hypothetical protein MKX03_002595 [Papaver bracteatum]|nr:hypothetical protein MKX03_002595 [Papaver bracteatum]
MQFFSLTSIKLMYLLCLLVTIAYLKDRIKALIEDVVCSRISKEKVSDYSKKIEILYTSCKTKSLEAFDGDRVKEIPSKPEQGTHIPSPRLRRRSHYKVKDRLHEIKESDSSAPIKLDAEEHTHLKSIGNLLISYEKLQEDLTDEMVGLAQRLKESSLMMSCSIQDTEKVLDSTERAVEHSLASTGNENSRAMEIYSRTFSTTCFTWLLFFVMICVFLIVIVLIRLT